MFSAWHLIGRVVEEEGFLSVARLNGVDLYYEVFGDGPPLVFVHGASGSHLSWWQQVPAFCGAYTCVTYDQRGFGKSIPTGPYDPGDGRALIDDLKNLIDHVGLGTERVCVIGSSLGTMPALGFAAEHRERMSALVLSNGFGGLSSTGLDRKRDSRTATLRAVTESKESTAPSNAMVPHAKSSDEAKRIPILYSPQGPMGPQMPGREPFLAFLYAELALALPGPPIMKLDPGFRTGRPVSTEEASKLDIPVLVLGGECDHVFPPEEMREAASLLANARCKIIPGAGHSVYFENPAAYNAAIAEFLNEVGHMSREIKPS